MIPTMSMKFEFKDYVALVGALLTVGSVLWKGGEITSKLEQTAQAVRDISPVVHRLDTTTSRLEERATSNKSRIDDLTNRVGHIEEYNNRRK